MEKETKKKKKKHFLFELFYRTQKDGKGVEKTEMGPPNLANFFPLYKRQFGNVVKLNLLMLFGNFPLLFGFFALTGYLNHTSSAPASELFSPLFGAITAKGGVSSPADMLLFGVHGVQTEQSVMSTATYIFIGLAALVIFTFGFVNVGTSYILRNIVRGEPIFFWEDFRYAIRRNWKQALIYGILDCIIFALLAYNITLSYFNLGNMVVNVVFFSNLLLAFVYFIMRFYIYIMMVTFELSLFKLFKNAFIFSLLGFRRNALAVTGIGLSMAVTYTLLIVFQPIGILIPFVLLFGTGALMGAYAAYPKIKQIMIDPYYKSDRPDAEALPSDQT